MNESIFSVKVQANAKKNEVVSFDNGTYKIKISAPAIDNKANKELINYLSKVTGVRKSDIKIISGEHSHNKRIKILDFNGKILKVKSEK